MHEIEHAVGEDNLLAGGTQFRDKGDGFRSRIHIVTRRAKAFSRAAV
jgi:hypothetical protein